MHFGINYLGHFALTPQLLPLLRKAQQARVVNVSSLVSDNVSSIDFEQFNQGQRYQGMQAYQWSKLANIMFSSTLAQKLKVHNNQVTSVALNPGLTHTNLRRHIRWRQFFAKWFGQAPQEGAKMILNCATHEKVHNGDYVTRRGFGQSLGEQIIRGPNPLALSKPACQRLWQLSLDWTKLKDPF